jgi:hypothetical protein
VIFREKSENKNIEKHKTGQTRLPFLLFYFSSGRNLFCLFFVLSRQDKIEEVVPLNPTRGQITKSWPKEKREGTLPNLPPTKSRGQAFPEDPPTF